MTQPFPFEESMATLEEVVLQLEKGELTLEESLKQFEKGIYLARQCQQILNEAEQKIEILAASNLENNGTADD